jgi:pSer/pThr/pTyr-binding forkhead associated (FHA) protein
VQRRRRLLLRQNGETMPSDIADSFAASAEVVAIEAGVGISKAAHHAPDSEPARRQLFQECQGRPGVQMTLEVAGEARKRKVTLDQPFLVIGSDRGCDVQIGHPAVLPHHAYLQWTNGRLFWCSLAGPDSQIPVVATWIDRNSVALGPIRFSVRKMETLAEGFPDPQSRCEKLAAEIPQVQLKFSGVEQQDNLWPIDRSLSLIGRGPQCKLRLDHPAIPPVLACLIRTPSSCWLVNPGRHESLRVNDRPVLLESLDFGDKLQLGRFQAEVCAAPISLKSPRPIPTGEPRNTAAVLDLAARHRKRLGALNKSLADVKVYLDAGHPENVPELKTALTRYIQHAQRHHSEMQQALERLSGG